MGDSVGKLEAACLASRQLKLEEQQRYQAAAAAAVVVAFVQVELEG